jgi:hypothetical protein
MEKFSRQNDVSSLPIWKNFPAKKRQQFLRM